MTLPPAIHLDTGKRPGVRHERWAVCGAAGLRIAKTTDRKAVTCRNCVRRMRRAKGESR